MFYFYNKSCFHGYDYKKTIWLDSITRQQKMPRKSKGKLVHCSDFIRGLGFLALGVMDRKMLAKSFIQGLIETPSGILNSS